jgi:hypothetical protein
VLAAWAGTRALVFASAATVQSTGVSRASWEPGFLRHPFALLAIWDGRWYQIVAERGYLLVPGRASDPAFFPLLPALLRIAHFAGVPYSLAGIAIANMSFAVALIALYELGRHWLPEADARRAAIYAAVFPMAFVFSMIYPEGLALALITLGGLAAVRQRWFSCSVCVVLATLSRPEGVLLVLPVAAAAASSWSTLTPTGRGRALAALLAGPAALLSFSVYLWSTIGDPFAWSTAQHAWGRSFTATGIYYAAAELATSPSHHKLWLIKDAVFCSIYLLTLAVALRNRLPKAWIVAGAAIVLLPLASGTFTSDARFGLLAVPVYWGLAIIGRRLWLGRALMTGSLAFLVLGVFTVLLRFP